MALSSHQLQSFPAFSVRLDQKTGKQKPVAFCKVKLGILVKPETTRTTNKLLVQLKRSVERTDLVLGLNRYECAVILR